MGMRVWKEEESKRLSETDRECEARACEYGKKKRACVCRRQTGSARSTGMRVWKEEESKRLRSKGNLWNQEK